MPSSSLPGGPPALLPTDEDREDLLLSCRYGDLPDVQQFVAAFSPSALSDVFDDNGNTVLHMAAANGHTETLAYLLPLVPPHFLSHQNAFGSTPLHWAAVNKHLDAARALVQFRPPQGLGGAELIDIKNRAGRSSLGEAEVGGWDEGARWFVQVMKIDDEATQDEGAEEVDAANQADPDAAEAGGVEEHMDPSHAVEVEIQDADGQMARMTINPNTSASKNRRGS